jgi:hypothetical protein
MFEHLSSSGRKKQKLIATISLPWLLSICFIKDPVCSYIIAWLGSFFIFYLTILSPLRCLEEDTPVSQQVMRPIILLQLVFAGFMCCTSIFYFLDHAGYRYISDLNSRNFVVNDETYELARCQRYYLLGHTCLVTGLILLVKRRIVSHYQLSANLNQLLLPACIICLLTGKALSSLPGLGQFSILLRGIAEFSGTLLLVKGASNKNLKQLLFGGLIYAYILMEATLTGYKEAVIVKILMLLFLMFPYFKKVISTIAIPVIAILLYILPTLATTIRAQAWTGSDSAEQARLDAYELLVAPDPFGHVSETNWDFLKDRFSEIGMFRQYINFVPLQHGYYGFELLGNSLTALIPRVLWKDKPNTELVSMQRVYESGAVNRLSEVSAKTRPIVDGYLSAGTVGICIVMLAYGLLAQSICNTAERCFDGYECGCILLFNGIFQQLWRGNNLEFLINNVFYGCLLMGIIFLMLRKFKFLVPLQTN